MTSEASKGTAGSSRALGFLWKPARNERTLALFALSIVAVAVVVGGIGVTLAFDDRSLPSELITIGSTAVGFVGGLLAGSRREPDLRNRLEDLRDLHSDGLITREEHDHVRAALLTRVAT